jgi:hypothetical protein
MQLDFLSYGETRKLNLFAAKLSSPHLLLQRSFKLLPVACKGQTTFYQTPF